MNQSAANALAHLETIFASGHTVLMHRHPDGQFYCAASGGGIDKPCNARGDTLEKTVSDLALHLRARGKRK